MKQASFTKPKETTSLWSKLASYQWRRSHLVSACAISIGLIFSLALLPSDDVEAKRSANTTTRQVNINFADPIVDPILEEPSEPELIWHEQKVRNGDNLTTIFNREKLGADMVRRVSASSTLAKKLARMLPGQKLAFGYGVTGELQELKYTLSQLESYRFTRAEDSFVAEHILLKPEVVTAYRSGAIESSLFLAGEAASLPHKTIMDLANIFGWDIDFALDIREGDEFFLVFEEKFLHGEKISTGNILAASFTNRGKTFKAVRYTDSSGSANYYTPGGLSMRKAFLRAPLDFTRVSSNFNPNRLHPIFKTNRPHRGVDYAARLGTPVYAAGNGTVIKAGYTRANGNFIVIQHGQKYITKYLHLHRKRVKKGQRVRQRQTIGTVGSTGYSTGPHLHYEFLVNGVHCNPRTVKLPRGKPIAESERANFKLKTAPLIALLDNKGNSTEQYALSGS